MTDQQKAERVLACLGQPIGRLSSLATEFQERFAALCSEQGFIVDGKRHEAESVWRDYCESQKATVDAPVEGT